jgi:hypothetical protein
MNEQGPQPLSQAPPATPAQSLVPSLHCCAGKIVNASAAVGEPAAARHATESEPLARAAAA